MCFNAGNTRTPQVFESAQAKQTPIQDTQPGVALASSAVSGAYIKRTYHSRHHTANERGRERFDHLFWRQKSETREIPHDSTKFADNLKGACQ